MIENISKKQEKIQEKIQKQQEMNDKDCRELTDEELEQLTGGMPGAAEVSTVQLGTLAGVLVGVPLVMTQLTIDDTKATAKGADAEVAPMVKLN